MKTYLVTLRITEPDTFPFGEHAMGAFSDANWWEYAVNGEAENRMPVEVVSCAKEGGVK